MTRRLPAAPRLWHRRQRAEGIAARYWLALACGLGLNQAALAAQAEYRCEGDLPMTARMTPREAHITLDGQNWDLRRVRDKGDARYVNAAQGLTLTLKRSLAEFERKGQPPLQCKLVVRALRPEAQ
jgi:hypothetical protein